MKTILIIILLTISIFATQKEYVRDIPKNVVDLNSLAFIDSKKAFFIIGNDKYGSMKKSWAFKNKEIAQKYAEMHGGCIIDYETYVKMDDKAVEEYVKEHGIVIKRDTNVTKPIKSSKPSVDKNSNSVKKTKSYEDIYSIETLRKLGL